MSWIYGFFMAWGMFLAIPCPVKIWSEKARPRMMICLPLVGLVVGGIWAFLAWGLEAIQCPWPLYAAILAAAPFLITGFMHLDGYMDVCDAVLSRRDLETRQRILKDSHCGAFGVVCLVLLVLAQWSAFLSAGALCLPAMVMIPVATRSAAALAVLSLRPMGTSQYARMERSKNGGKLLLIGMLAVSCAGPAFLGGQGLAPLASTAAYALAAAYGYKNLDGMSGDISGFALTIGEFAGTLVLALGGKSWY